MARILVVDDEPDMRMALANVLSRIGHQVFESGDGPGALEFLAKDGADLVLLDMRLPGMDGPQILRALRERDKTTPVVMVTGYGSVESAVEVMRLGASHYLSKPFSNQELVETVERILKGGRMPAPSAAPKLPAPTAPSSIAVRGESVPAPAAEDRGLWTALACAAALAVLVGFWAARRSDPGRDFAIPHQHVTALAWSGSTLWTADWVSQSVYKYRLNGGKLEAVTSVHLPDTTLTGMAASADRLFIADAGRKVIEERRLDEALSLVRSHPAPGPSPSGLYWDGRYLWSSDAAQGRIYRHGGDGNLEVLESFKSPAKSPAGLHKDESFLWSADSETRRVYRHRLDKSLSVLSVYALPSMDRGPEPLSAFALEGGSIWFARDGRAVVYERPLKSFSERPQGG